MKFAIIDGAAKSITIQDHQDVISAERAAGLEPGGVDDGTAAQGLAIVVAEFGLFEPAEKQSYFSIGRRLYAGNAVLYAYDEEGETRDVGNALPRVTFYHGAREVELAIDANIITRPRMTIGGQVLWRWPEPKPDGISR